MANSWEECLKSLNVNCLCDFLSASVGDANKHRLLAPHDWKWSLSP